MFTIRPQYLILVIVIVFVGCGNRTEKNELVIFHAGSLTEPFHVIAAEFEKENTAVKVLLEAAGSRECARKITELNKPCDIIATSDYKVIETLLIPEYCDWVVAFAGNEMCIAYTNSSRNSDEISHNNWYEILMNDSIYFGRSDPESDPCGYRTVILFELAEKYYQAEGLASGLKQKDLRFIRPKEVDLLALLESHAIDYMFIYTSVARQHELNFIELPDEINLSNPDFAGFYSLAGIELSGRSKNEKIFQKGEPMLYGISILKNAPDKLLAEKFLQFLLKADKGKRILEQHGQQTLVDSNSKYMDQLPDGIKKYLKYEK